MTDFKTELLRRADVSDRTYSAEDLKALESKSNFVLKSDAVEDLGGPEGSAVFLEYSAASNQPSFSGLLKEEAGSGTLGLYLKVSGKTLNDELFYLVLQNFRSMLRVPGVMVKGAGKELWVRIGKKAQVLGIGLKELAAILSARIKAEFPEIESVEACFIRGKGPVYEQLNQASEVFYQNSEKLKAKVWEDRGFNFKDCHVLGHCGKCADKKLCANVRRIGRLSEAHRINQ